MKAFSTKDEMLAAYSEANPELHRTIVADKAKYAPHLYRGGFVIRGFGFSIERIGKFVSKENCGEPSLV